MARYLLDTNIIVYLITQDHHSVSKDVKSILQNYENSFLISMETVEELIVAYRAKKLLSKIFPTAIQMVESLQRDYGLHIVQVDMEVMRTLANLTINEIEKHYDPSDHIIISQAITMKIPLISSDGKFPFYRKQGLDLVYNDK